MDKREIRVSIFFSDLFVFDLSRHQRKLEKMMLGANEFFGKYRLRIDSFPFPYDYMAYKDAFVFTAGQGVKPDMGMDELAHKMREDDKALEALHAEEALTTTSDARKAEIRKEVDRRHAIAQTWIWDGFNHNAEYDFRMLLGERYAKNRMLKKYAREWKTKPRLNIVFCEFIKLPEPSKTNMDVVGEFLPSLTRTKKNSYRGFKKPIPAFEAPFIIIDLRQTDWHTLAHEIVHGNGHTHPTGSYGGYYDGPQESIMNYFSGGLGPKDTILEDTDLKNLEQAFFVRE
jgi:hypothetical protein